MIPAEQNARENKEEASIPPKNLDTNKNNSDIELDYNKEKDIKSQNDQELRSLSFINPDLFQRIHNTISLQNILIEINDIEIDESVKLVESLGFLSTDHNFTILIRNVAFMSIFRPLYILSFSKLIKQILNVIEHTESDNPKNGNIQIYNNIILNELFHYIFISDEINCFNSFIHLTYHLYKENVLSAESIIDQINKYFNKYIISRAAAASVFAMFLPELYALNQSAYSKILSYINIWVSDDAFNPKACQFFKNFDYYKLNNFEKLKEMRDKLSCCFLYFDIFINDDIEELRNIASNPEFNVNEMIESPFLSPFYFLANDYSLLSCSASFGAVECFKYLIQNGAKYDNEENTTQVPQYSMIGGSIEIIRICEQFNMNFNGSLQSSATFFRNDIFEYLYDSKYNNLMEVSPTKAIVILQAATSNNLELMLTCLEMKCDVNQRDEYDMNCLKKASFFGLSEMTELLLTIPEIEVNQGELGFAAQNGHYDTCKLIIEKVKERGLDFDINFIGVTAKPPLFDAIVHSHLKCVDLIYKNGGNAHFQTKEGYSIYHFIATQNDIRIFEYFKDKVEFNINLRTRMLFTPLLLCVMNMASNMLEFILNDYKDGIDCMNFFFSIRLAIFKGNIHIIKPFLKLSKHTDTIIQLVKESNNDKLIQYVNENS